jgi:hypothetical protein
VLIVVAAMALDTMTKETNVPLVKGPRLKSVATAKGPAKLKMMIS